MKKRKIVVVGDSHTDAVKRALRAGATAPAIEVTAYRYALEKNGKTIGDMAADAIAALAASLGKDDLLVSTIGGNQHQIVALMQHPQAFDLFSPGQQPQSDTAEIIPYAQLWDYFEAGIRAKDGARLQALAGAAGCRVVHCVPPPPKEDADHIIRHHESYFANSGISEKGVSPAALRLKIWQLQADVLASLAPELGVQLLLPPALSLTAAGFLARDFYADDATHGNHLYGKALIAQLVETVSLDAPNESIP